MAQYVPGQSGPVVLPDGAPAQLSVAGPALTFLADGRVREVLTTVVTGPTGRAAVGPADLQLRDSTGALVPLRAGAADTVVGVLAVGHASLAYAPGGRFQAVWSFTAELH